MYRSSSRRGASTAPHSPMGSPFQRSMPPNSGNGSAAQNKKKQQTSALVSHRWRNLFRTAPTSPRDASTRPRNIRSKIVNHKNENSPFSHQCEEDDTMDEEEELRTPTAFCFARSRKCKVQAPQHRKSYSYEGGTTETGYLHPIEEDGFPAIPNSVELGNLLLNLATAMYLSGDNSFKALECASKAAKVMERASEGVPCAELVRSYHVLAAIHCRLGNWEEAVNVLRRATCISFSDEDVDLACASFYCNMQLGEVLMMLGKQSSALASYYRAYETQRKALGEMDPQVGETCSYLAEAYLQALQLDEASRFCKLALDIHAVHGNSGSMEEAMDRQLMALILRESGEYKQALEHLVLANVALVENSRDMDVAMVDLNIGEMYGALGRYDEAVFSYRRALSFFKSRYGENHVTVASVHVRLAEQYVKTGKRREAKAYCESALGIYGRQNAQHLQANVATGLSELALVYERMNEREQALLLLERALVIFEGIPGHQNDALGIEGQMGVLYYALGMYDDAYVSFRNALAKLRATGEMRSALVASLLNQMGLACLGLNEIYHSLDLFLEAKTIFEEIWGTVHAYTLAVMSNLAGAYDAIGRSEEAIVLLENIVEIKEEYLGTLHPEIEEEKSKLVELLNEAGRERVRKTNTLKELLFNNLAIKQDDSMKLK